jgi:hypothetical protein
MDYGPCPSRGRDLRAVALAGILDFANLIGRAHWLLKQPAAGLRPPRPVSFAVHRMARTRIFLPIPTAHFTVKELKAQYPQYSASVIQKNLEEWLAAGRVRRVGTEMPPGNRKPLYVYEPVPGAR